MSDRIGPLRTSTLGLIGMMLSLTLQSVALTFAPPATAGVLFLVFIFTQGIAGWMFYPGQVAHLVRITPEASVIALSLNASAMYIGFAGGSALGGVVLSTLSSNHLGWIGGCAEAAALVLVLAGHLLKRPKPAQIAG